MVLLHCYVSLICQSRSCFMIVSGVCKLCHVLTLILGNSYISYNVSQCVVFRCGLYANIKIQQIVEQVSQVSGKTQKPFYAQFQNPSLWIQQKCTVFNIVLHAAVRLHAVHFHQNCLMSTHGGFKLSPKPSGWLCYWLLQIVINAFASDDSVLEQLHPLQWI